MPPIKRQPGGWVLPGYKYLGPFNPLENGEPVNKADRAAQAHDKSYSELIKSGKNPYLYFNKADEKFIDDLKNDWSLGGIIGSSFFKLKRDVTPALGNKERAQKDIFTLQTQIKVLKNQKITSLNQALQKCLKMKSKTNNHLTQWKSEEEEEVRPVVWEGGKVLVWVYPQVAG